MPSMETINTNNKSALKVIATKNEDPTLRTNFESVIASFVNLVERAEYSKYSTWGASVDDKFKPILARS